MRAYLVVAGAVGTAIALGGGCFLSGAGTEQSGGGFSEGTLQGPTVTSGMGGSLTISSSTGKAASSTSSSQETSSTSSKSSASSSSSASAGGGGAASTGSTSSSSGGMDAGVCSGDCVPSTTAAWISGKRFASSGMCPGSETAIYTCMDNTCTCSESASGSCGVNLQWFFGSTNCSNSGMSYDLTAPSDSCDQVYDASGDSYKAKSEVTSNGTCAPTAGTAEQYFCPGMDEGCPGMQCAPKGGTACMLATSPGPQSCPTGYMPHKVYEDPNGRCCACNENDTCPGMTGSFYSMYNSGNCNTTYDMKIDGNCHNFTMGPSHADGTVVNGPVTSTTTCMPQPGPTDSNFYMLCCMM